MILIVALISNENINISGAWFIHEFLYIINLLFALFMQQITKLNKSIDFFFRLKNNPSKAIGQTFCLSK